MGDERMKWNKNKKTVAAETNERNEKCSSHACFDIRWKLQTRHKHIHPIELHTRIEIMAVWQPPDDYASCAAQYTEIFWLLSKKMVCNRINTFDLRTQRSAGPRFQQRAFSFLVFYLRSVKRKHISTSFRRIFCYIRIYLFRYFYVTFIFRLFFPRTPFAFAVVNFRISSCKWKKKKQENHQHQIQDGKMNGTFWALSNAGLR